MDFSRCSNSINVFFLSLKYTQVVIVSHTDVYVTILRHSDVTKFFALQVNYIFLAHAIKTRVCHSGLSVRGLKSRTPRKSVEESAPIIMTARRNGSASLVEETSATLS